MNPDTLIEVCRRLNAADVRYAVVGGWAVTLHGYQRATRDIDLLLDDNADNVENLKTALRDLMPVSCEELTATDLQDNTVVRMIEDDLIVDLMRQIGDVKYPWIQEHIERETVADVEIPVADLEAMLKMKQGMRDVDQRDYLFLKGKQEYLARGKRK